MEAKRRHLILEQLRKTKQTERRERKTKGLSNKGEKQRISDASLHIAKMIRVTPKPEPTTWKQKSQPEAIDNLINNLIDNLSNRGQTDGS